MKKPIKYIFKFFTILAFLFLIANPFTTVNADSSSGSWSYDSETKTITLNSDFDYQNIVRASSNISQEVESFRRDVLKIYMKAGNITIYDGFGDRFPNAKEIELEGGTILFARYCFKEHANIEKITINGTFSAQLMAFYKCSNLKTIYIKELQYMEDDDNCGAFNSSKNIESVHIERCLNNSYIGANSFSSSGNNMNFTIDDSNGVSFGRDAFSYAKLNNVYIKGTKVSYGSSIFAESTLNSFVSDTYITNVSECMFYKCSVKKVSLNRLEKIPNSMFDGCKTLTELTIEYVTDGFRICSSAFNQAGSGLELTFKANDIFIENGAFSGSNFNKVTFEGQNLTVDYEAFYGTNVSEVYFNTTNTMLSGTAFEYSNIKKVHIKEIKSIGDGREGVGIPKYDGAFAGASKLESIVIDTCPDNLKIGSYAFVNAGASTGFDFEINCNNLTIGYSAFLYSNISNLTLNGRNLTIESCAFQSSNIQNAYLNTTATIISEEAFDRCSKLKNLYIYELTSIAAGNKQYGRSPYVVGPFVGCTSLKSVVIDGFKNRTDSETEFCEMLDPQQISIGVLAFYGSGNNMDLTIRGDKIHLSSELFENASFNDVNIYCNSVSIDTDAFLSTQMNKATFYGTITSLGRTAFEHSTVKEVYINKLLAMTDGYKGSDTDLYHGVFGHCDSLKKVVFSEVADNFKIGSYNFSSTGNGFDLSINAGDGIEICENAFLYSNVKTIIINGENLVIKNEAFQGSDIEEVFFNTTNTVFGKEIFYTCKKLKNVTVLDLMSMEEGYQGSDVFSFHGTFSYCSALEKITIGNAHDDLAFTQYAFSNAKENVKIYINNGKDITFNNDAILYGKLGELLFNVETVDFKNNSFTTNSGNKAYLSNKVTDLSLQTTLETMGYTVEITDVDMEYNGRTYSPDGNVIYKQTGGDFKYQLYEIKDKSITSLVLIDNCIGIKENALQGINLTYNELNGGFYLGSASNQYKALILTSSNYSPNPTTEFIYESCFNSSTNITITVTDEMGTISALDYKNAGSVTLIVPNTWETIGPSKYNNCGITGLEEVSNITISFADDNNIKYISKEEFNSLLYVDSAPKPKIKYKSNFTGSLDIVSYSKVGTSEEHEYLIGEMFYAKLTGYSGKVFYVWSIVEDSNKAVRIFDDNDTYRNFKGYSSNDEDFYYLTSGFCSTMKGDNINEGEHLNLKVCVLTSNGIEILVEKTIELEGASLEQSIPLDQTFKIALGKTVCFDDLLVEMGIPHALRCVTTFNARVIEGENLVDFNDTYFVAKHLGNITIKYDCKSSQCYCHGEPETVHDRVFHFEVVCPENSFMEENPQISITLDPVSYYYDGIEKNPTLTVVDNKTSKTLILGTDYIIAAASILKATNPNTYYVIVEGIGDYFDYRVLSWQILKQDNPFTVSLEDWIYKDNPNDYVLKDNKSSGNKTAYYKLKTEDDSEYKEGVPTVVGEYSIKVKVAEDAFYNESSATTDFEIKPRLIKLPEEDTRKFYYTGLDIKYNTYQTEFYNKPYNGTQTEIGEYDIIYELKDKVNTKWENDSIENVVYIFKIEPNRIQKPVDVEFYFDGETHKTGANLVYVKCLDKETGEGAERRNVGITTVVNSLQDPVHTIWEDGTYEPIETTLTILKIAVTVKAKDCEKNFGDSDPWFGYEIVSDEHGILSKDYIDSHEIFVFNREEGEDPGKYKIQITNQTYFIFNGNVDFTYVDGTLTINKSGKGSNNSNNNIDNPKNNNPLTSGGTTNIIKCVRHWLILVFVIIYFLIELLIIMLVSKEKVEETLEKNTKTEIVTETVDGKEIKKEIKTKYRNGKEVKRKVRIIETDEEDGKIKEENRFIKFVKTSPVQNILLLLVTFIYIFIFIILCIYGRCFICFIFNLVLFILMLLFTFYALLPCLTKTVDKYKEWNRKRQEKIKEEPKKEPETFIEKVKAKASEIVNKALDSIEDGINKAEEAQTQVSLSDATKAALLNPPTFLINKKTIADYLEDKYDSKDVIVNRKANVVANTKLPLADTHYVKIMEGTKENKACFVYVYELETMYMDKQCKGMLLLMKSDLEKFKEYQKEHKSMKISAFPIGGQWIAMPIDSSYDWFKVTALLDEAYDYQMELLAKKIQEKKDKKNQEKEAKKQESVKSNTDNDE